MSEGLRGRSLGDAALLHHGLCLCGAELHQAGSRHHHDAQSAPPGGRGRRGRDGRVVVEGRRESAGNEVLGPIPERCPGSGRVGLLPPQRDTDEHDRRGDGPHAIHQIPVPCRLDRSPTAPTRHVQSQHLDQHLGSGTSVVAPRER
ncbi:uncharacterized protein LOC143038422 [Oratosquilla oratoria]|uniref:uncharacterized protein LOC143038422 n=1 Tax=Oratosquilla oratoria TaxID=337810 RepID=UPI003F765C4E